MRPLVIFIGFYFNCFCIFFILKLIIIYKQHIQSFFLEFYLFFKSLHKVHTFPFFCPMEARAYAGSTRQREVKWGKGFLVIVARRAFSFKRVPVLERLHQTWYATISNLKNISRIAKTLSFLWYRFPTPKRSLKRGEHRVLISWFID